MRMNFFEGRIRTRREAPGQTARQTAKRASLIKAALYLAIALFLVLSCIFIGSAQGPDYTELAGKDVAFKTVDPLSDASGEESIFENSLIDPTLILGQEMPVIYGVDLQEVYSGESLDAQDKNDTGTDIYFDVLPEDIKMDILKFTSEGPKAFSVGTQGPQILIYHTHTEEAYRQIEGQEYVESGDWRTADVTQSVVAVGEALAQELEEYGYSVLHDTTDHEPPSLSTAYSRSLVTMENDLAKYPTLKVFIDLHRDAYNDIEAGMDDYVVIDGKECARVMFVVGTGEGKTGEGFDEKPNYESNYKLALAITNELESMEKGFTRPIRVKTGRYNQQVSDMCLLIEVGHNANSLEQALNTTQYIALALSRVLDVE